MMMMVMVWRMFWQSARCWHIAWTLDAWRANRGAVWSSTVWLFWRPQRRQFQHETLFYIYRQDSFWSGHCARNAHKFRNGIAGSATIIIHNFLFARVRLSFRMVFSRSLESDDHVCNATETHSHTKTNTDTHDQSINSPGTPCTTHVYRIKCADCTLRRLPAVSIRSTFPAPPHGPADFMLYKFCPAIRTLARERLIAFIGFY